MPALFVGVGLTIVVLRRLLPWLHNVPANPFELLVRRRSKPGSSPSSRSSPAACAKRCSARSCCDGSRPTWEDPAIGLTIVSLAFGAGHVVQGLDAAVATALLGLAWGAIYLRRGSAVAPIVSHAGYNGAQILS